MINVKIKTRSKGGRTTATTPSIYTTAPTPSPGYAVEALTAETAKALTADSPTRAEFDKRYMSITVGQEVQAYHDFVNGIKAKEFLVSPPVETKIENGQVGEANYGLYDDASAMFWETDITGRFCVFEHRYGDRGYLEYHPDEGFIVDYARSIPGDPDAWVTATSDVFKARQYMEAPQVDTEEMNADRATVRGDLSVRNLNVTGAASFFSLTVDEIKSAGGAYLITPADGFTVERVTQNGTDYRLEWKNTDGTRGRRNMWQTGDQALCQTFNLTAATGQAVQNRLWWAVVKEAGAAEDYNYIVLDFSDAGRYAASNATPQKGDEVVMLGHRPQDARDPEEWRRSSAIYFSSYVSIDPDLSAPLFATYEGITDFELSSHRVRSESPDGIDITADRFRVRSGNDTYQIPAERGEWIPGTRYNYYDRVSYQGGLYLCTSSTGAAAGEQPGQSSKWTRQVSKGEDAITVNITTEAATSYKEEQPSVILFAHVFRGGVEITDTIAPEAFTWSVQAADGNTYTTTGRSRGLNTAHLADVAVVKVEVNI